VSTPGPHTPVDDVVLGLADLLSAVLVSVFHLLKCQL
jgi:hypothetical protein